MANSSDNIKVELKTLADYCHLERDFDSRTTLLLGSFLANGQTARFHVDSVGLSENDKSSLKKGNDTAPKTLGPETTTSVTWITDK